MKQKINVGDSENNGDKNEGKGRVLVGWSRHRTIKKRFQGHNNF